MTRVRTHFRKLKNGVVRVVQHSRRVPKSGIGSHCDRRQERAEEELRHTPVEVQYVRGLWFVKTPGTGVGPGAPIAGWTRVEGLSETADVHDVANRFERPVIVSGAVGKTMRDRERALGVPKGAKGSGGQASSPVDGSPADVIEKRYQAAYAAKYPHPSRGELRRERE